MPRILIVENNAKASDIIGQHLQKKGLAVDVAADGDTALRFFSSRDFDLLLVNLK